MINMAGLEDFTISEVLDYIVRKQVEERGITRSQARKLVINALSYNIVVAAIDEQIDYLIDNGYADDLLKSSR